VPFPILGAGLVVIMFVSAYQEPKQFAVLQVMLVLGLLGWLMKSIGMPRAPFLIGFVLSIPMERYYFLTSRLYTTGEWIVRPGVLIMAAILVLPLLLALRRRLATSKSEAAPEPYDEDEGPDVGHLEDTRLPVVLAALFTLMFAGALVGSFGFSERAALMPRVVGIVGGLLAVAFLVVELRAGRRAPIPWHSTLRTVGAAFAWLVAFVALVYVVGTMLAALIFIPAFLFVVARWEPLKIAIYTVVVLAALWVLHEYAEIALPVGLYTPGVLR
jgi:hypothetical protein